MSALAHDRHGGRLRDLRDRLSRFRPRMAGIYGFWKRAVLRFWHDELFSKAASLGFQTALALVPLFTIVVAILSAFPGFDSLVMDVETWLFSILAPHSVDAIASAFSGLLERGAQATAVGAVSLVVVCIMLLRTIGDTFDSIFRVRQGRPLAFRLATYWCFLTLGPLLFAAALSLSGQLFSEGDVVLGGALHLPVTLARALLPFVIEWVGFVLVYWLMPSRQPPLRDVLLAGAVAAILFEGIKAGLGLYLSTIANYEVLYGALTAIPVTLLWLELAWAITLFGAVVAALLGDRRAERGELEPETL